jgi:hypothetical protein
VSDVWQALFDKLAAQGWETRVIENRYWLFTPWGECKYHGVIGDHKALNRLQWRLIEHGISI